MMSEKYNDRGLKPSVVTLILLVSIPGLMFMIIPVPGMEFRFSWELASLWLGGVAFSALLSSWWRRGFFLLALLRTAILPTDIEAYMALLMIAIFLAAAEGFKRTEGEHTINAFSIAAICLLLWTLTQKLGIAPLYFGDRSVGPFNPDTGGIFLALCLPAAFRPRWWPLIPCILWGIYVSHCSTAFLAALVGMGVFMFISIKISRFARNDKQSTPSLVIPSSSPVIPSSSPVTPDSSPVIPSEARNLVTLLRVNSVRNLITIGMIAVLFLSLGAWIWKVDPIKNTLSCNRWIAWKHAAWSMRSELWGRGLGSWEKTFPLLASGDSRIGHVEPTPKGIVETDVFVQAHNEYIQMGFELGIHAFIFLILFSVFTFIAMIRGAASPYAAAGMMALIVSCLGFFTLHIAPTALLGMAWMGMWERSRKS